MTTNESQFTDVQPTADDVEGHLRRLPVADDQDVQDDDVTGHRRMPLTDDEDDDVAGHLRRP